MTSNRLPVLAAEIRCAHADVQDAAKTAAERALAAGHALIEAKELVKHGEWLPWLRTQCALAERTAQLYMKLAKSGATPQTIATLGLQGASQVLMTIFDADYDPWCDCDAEGKRDWHIFMLYLTLEEGWYVEGAWRHTEWILQRGFASLGDWFGEKGSRWRRGALAGGGLMKDPSPAFLALWEAFHARYRDRSLEDLEEELTSSIKSADRCLHPHPSRKESASAKPQRLRF